MKKLLILAVVILALSLPTIAQPSEADGFPAANSGEVFVTVDGNTVTLTTTILWVDQFWLTLTLPSGDELVMAYGYLPNTVWNGYVMPILPEIDPVELVAGTYLLRGLEGPFEMGLAEARELFALEFEIKAETGGRSMAYWIYFPEGNTGFASFSGNRLVQCSLPNTPGLEWGEYYLYGHQTVFVKHEGIEILLYSNQPWKGTHPILDEAGAQVALFEIQDLTATAWSRCTLAP
jgi:hypothetical protein